MVCMFLRWFARELVYNTFFIRDFLCIVNNAVGFIPVSKMQAVRDVAGELIILQ